MVAFGEYADVEGLAGISVIQGAQGEASLLEALGDIVASGDSEDSDSDDDDDELDYDFDDDEEDC